MVMNNYILCLYTRAFIRAAWFGESHIVIIMDNIVIVL